MAPGKRYGAGSSRMGVAHHGERSVFGSMFPTRIWVRASMSSEKGTTA